MGLLDVFEYRILKENEVDEAYELCFYEFIKHTKFMEFEYDDESSLDLFKILTKKYHEEYKTTLHGCFYKNDLIGFIEINNCYISHIAVKSRYQHLGIGYNLFLEATNDKKPGEIIYGDADINALNTYKSWGFTTLEDENKMICKIAYKMPKEKTKRKCS